MGEELAGKWLHAGVPSWLYRWVMPVAWVAAFAVSLIGSDQTPCSVTDPSDCGPDITFSLAMIPCLTSLLAWWWLPRLAAVAGLVFLVLDLRYDDVESAHTAWTVYGAGCVAVLVALTWSRLRRRELLARVHRVPVMIGPANPIGFTPALAGIAVLVVAGFAVLGVMRWQVDREQVHLDRAVKTTAVVVGFKDDDLLLRLPDGSSRRTSSLDYPKKGDELPVLVDPQDADWVRLQAELADYTMWWTVAGGAWLLALLILRHDLVRRRARPRRTWSGSGLPVWIESAGMMGFTVWPTEGREQVLGFIVLEPDDTELSSYRGNALLVGDLEDGAWPTVVIGAWPAAAVGDRILRPVTSFRTPRRSPWSVEEPALRQLDQPVDEDEDEEQQPVQPEPVAALPELPWRVPQSAFSWWDPAERFQRILVTSSGLRIRRGIFTETVEWRDVESVEIDEGDVILTTADDWHVIGCIPSDRLAEVAGVIETLRRQALS